MLYSDVDRKIGYMFSVSMVQGHPLIPLMEKEFGDVPLHPDRVGGEGGDVHRPLLAGGKGGKVQEPRILI